MSKIEKATTTAFCIFVMFASIAVAVYAPYREKEVFNKYKSPDKPDATYMDAVFSKLRVTSE